MLFVAIVGELRREFFSHGPGGAVSTDINRRREACFNQLVLMVTEIPAIICGGIVLCTLYRAPRLIRMLRSPLCPDSATRCRACYIQFDSLIFDVLATIAMVLLLIPTVYRLPTLYTQWQALRARRRAAAAVPASPSAARRVLTIDSDTFASHKLIFEQCSQLFQDLPFIVLGAIVMCCPWRTLWFAYDIWFVPNHGVPTASIRRRLAVLHAIKVTLHVVLCSVALL